MRRTYRSRTTVGQYMAGILPRLASRQQVPTWPPDVFALCASVLSESGAYCQVLDHWPPADLKGRWFRTAERIAKEWRECWLDGYLAKPINPAELLTAIETTRQRTAKEAPAPDRWPDRGPASGDVFAPVKG